MQPGQVLDNILLIGFMGSGKSSVGRQLAISQGKRFIDIDKEIVDACGLALCTLFYREGEEGFRNWESCTLRRLSGQQGMILSTGGGIVLREENRVLLRKMGIVVWLDATAGILFERAMRSKERPLLQGEENPWKKFTSLLDLRRGLYRGLSDLYIDSSHLTHEEVTSKIMEDVATWKHNSAHHAAH